MDDPTKREIINTIEGLKAKLNNPLYVIQSTLNQAVNYIPAKLLDLETILNTTVTESKKFSNYKWDKYLQEELPDVCWLPDEKGLEFHQSEVNNISFLKNRIREEIEEHTGFKTIFWNITGGQRPFVLAVYQLVAEIKDRNHFICYIEGNTGQMVVLNGEFQKVNNFDYSLIKEQMDILKALSLMGFDVSSSENKVKVNNKKTLEDFKENSDKQELYASILKQYEDNKEVRRAFYALNKKKGKITEFGYKVFSEKQNEIKEEFQSYINEKKDKEVKEAPNPFGYILEEMASYKIYKVLSNLKEKQVIDMYASLKSYKYVDYQKNAQIDEFDIVLLTKYGQIINFECKSGGMTGTQAKKTNYSTYSIAGVYGTPILISPLLKEQIVNWKDAGYKRNKEDKEEVPDSVFTAYRSAVRVNIDVWGIDEIEEKLTNLLKTI